MAQVAALAARPLDREDFIRTAAAKGLSPAAIGARHVLPVATPPVVSLPGAYTPLLIGKVILIEKVFDIPRSTR